MAARSLIVVALFARTSFAGETTTTVVPPAPPAPPAPASPRSHPQIVAPAPVVVETEAPVPVAMDTRFLVDAMVGVGSDNLSLGIAARAGKTFEDHLYFGGLFDYQTGTSTSVASVSGVYLGGEAGYDFNLTSLPMTIRPYLGLGLASARATSMTTSATDTEISIWPGVVAHYQLQDSAFVVGGDLRIVTGPWGSSVGLFILGGMRFGS
jgi:hypothetical protein